MTERLRPDRPGARPLSVHIGLGANLDDPRQQVKRALDELQALPRSRLMAASRLYRTAPVGPADQPDYINAVACLQTRLAPLPLLRALQRIERRHGRVRDGLRWGPRTLDLDILLIGDLLLDLPGLRVPHPQMQHRAFVLVPLAEIAPLDLLIPSQGRLDALLARVDAAAQSVRALPLGGELPLDGPALDNRTQRALA